MVVEAASLSVGLGVRRAGAGCVFAKLEHCSFTSSPARGGWLEWSGGGADIRCKPVATEMPDRSAGPGRRQSWGWVPVHEGDTRSCSCRHTPETGHGVGSAAFASASRW